MRILVSFRADYHDGIAVPCYPWSYVRELHALGHEVNALQFRQARFLADTAREYDFVLEIDNGRDEDGRLGFRVPESEKKIKNSAVIFIDSHGHPDAHQAYAKHYSHVFFAVWDKRDLFAGHKSAHWCPNATDLEWFDGAKYRDVTPTFDVGFFGSKGGLHRAFELENVCKRNGWSADVRQVRNHLKPRWPATAEAMARCRILFNRGQKHDGPNQRVMESMAMGRPLITDHDERDGMSKLFHIGEHYLPYSNGKDIEQAIRLLIDYPNIGAKTIADNAYREVCAKHLVKHRVAQILEVVGG